MQKFIRFGGKALLLAGIMILLQWPGLAIFFPLEGMETSYLSDFGPFVADKDQ